MKVMTKENVETNNLALKIETDEENKKRKNT